MEEIEAACTTFLRLPHIGKLLSQDLFDLLL